MPLIDKFANPSKPIGSREPVWKGPCAPGQQGGVTQSLLGRFLQCRERFRLHVIEGLRPNDRFNHRIEYGNLFHLCEENRLAGRDWRAALVAYCRTLCQRYPTQQEEVNKWYNVCKIQYPVYVGYWMGHPDVKKLTPLMQEQIFDAPYTLPSGRVVRLRGKWDSVDLVDGGVWLQENKTKGDVDPEDLVRQLTFDLQTMMYLVALREYQRDGSLSSVVSVLGDTKPLPITGIRYNVVRRPLSGGKGTIVRKKGSKNVPPETEAEYYARLATYIEDEPETYFFRWNVTVTRADVDNFRRRCLDPLLESLCEWYDWVTSPVALKHGPFHDGGGRGVHFQHPYGVKSYLTDGGRTDLDAHLESGSEAGLRRVDDLFPELS